MKHGHTNPTNFRRALTLMAALWTGTGQAGLLDASSWQARNNQGTLLGHVRDNDGHSGSLLNHDQATVRCLIDLGVEATVHRIYFTATPAELDTSGQVPELTGSRTFTVSLKAGTSASLSGAAVLTRELRSVTGREIRVEANLRFGPVTARYLALDLNRGTALNHPWNIGEIEIYGWAGNRLTDRNEAVVLQQPAPAPLQLAAQELSYYLGELADRPVPVVTPSQASSFTGTLFKIMDLKSLAPTYAAMTNNQAQGLFPAAPINVEREGREIIFRAWPYRNVLWSVWEFLDRQGVKFVFPDAHGDFVPTGSDINLDVAPLQYTPSTDHIYANFGVEYLRDDPDAFLHFWRNRWTHTWGGHQRDAFGGSEVPTRPLPAYTPHPDYVEGFDGYPHNFRNVVPDRILERHPAWCGILTNQQWASWIGADKLNRRLPTGQNNCAFDMTHPELRQFVINKAIAVWNGHLPWNGPIYWLLPDDSILFSEDPASLALRNPLHADYVPYTFPYLHSVSGDYYDFIAAVADGIRTALPEASVGALAYSNTHEPPARTNPLPDNVLVDVCVYGIRNLPITSPKNTRLRERLETWAGLANNLRHYDYDLIHCETGPLRMPVPLVSAFADRARFFARNHMLAGGTQADLDTLPYNPWNYYAYPRFHWNVDTPAETVLGEFFTGYFREAAAPMMSYYTTIERYLIANHVSLQGRGYDYGLRVGAFPISVLRKMHQHLLTAESQATYWVTRDRIQKIREGFQWIMDQRELTLGDLTSTTAFPSVTPTQPYTLDLGAARIQTAGQDVGDAWFMFSWAQVGDYVRIATPGRYQVTFQAGMWDSDPRPQHRREMMFYIGAMAYGPFKIDHVSIDTYTLLVDIPAGTFEVAVEDLNNDGPYRVYPITLRKVENAPAPPPMRMTLNRVFDFAALGNPAETTDSDWDGASDLHELLAGTDELDSESYFAARCLTTLAGGDLCLTWPSVLGKRYALYRAREINGDYELVADHLDATPPENVYVDTGAGDETAFYQIAAY